MSHRDFLKLQAIDSGDVNKFEQYKVLRNSIKSELESEKVNYYRNKFYSPGMSVGSTWDAANDYLGSAKKSQSNTPSLLVDNGCIINSPRDIANAFNRIFIEKVHRINQSGLVNDVGNACHHLKKWLDRRDLDIPVFELKTIDQRKLRKTLQRLKGNRSSGIDFVDGYSIKLAAPLIEDVLLHLVNLTITKSMYPHLNGSYQKLIHIIKRGTKLMGRIIVLFLILSLLVRLLKLQYLSKLFNTSRKTVCGIRITMVLNPTTLQLLQLLSFMTFGCKQQKIKNCQ